MPSYGSTRTNGSKSKRPLGFKSTYGSNRSKSSCWCKRSKPTKGPHSWVFCVWRHVLYLRTPASPCSHIWWSVFYVWWIQLTVTTQSGTIRCNPRARKCGL
ncbi:hypothetical protein DPEC_G00119720 [Dallia pectoralis]|uniref:Uncharacterized protein n=1 Tax=Dallia pectoralis TaxID=75939 RepID=A0ACC2GPF4_DALPE|nr:hypothetical protein DPEC_G00119720 [Dallia pectoralis]